MDFSKMPNKKIYEFILSSAEPSSELKGALQSILRRAIEEPCHFQFLLHRVNWFKEPMSRYMDQLQRAIRLYRGKGKEAAKVAYNLLIQSLSIQQSNKLAIQSLKSLVNDAFHQEIIIQCLKQNYPHKLCPLSMHQAYLDSVITFIKAFPKYRFELLEIIIENLVHFDTQILIGDTHSHQHFPNDQQIYTLRKSPVSEIAQKYDTLLTIFLKFLDEEVKNEELFREIFLIFQRKILPIKSTKVIQFVVYFLAQSNKTMSSKFCSLLLANILDTDIQKQNWYRIFTQSNFYLVSYMIRSNRISFNKITQIINILITYLSQKISQVTAKELNEKLHLKELFYQNQRNLHILQTILTTIASFPELKQKIQIGYGQFIEETQLKLNFKYFLSENLLKSLNLKNEQGFSNRQRAHKIVLKFSNKFNPVILPEIARIIDPIFKWRINFNHFENIQENKLCKKLKKEEITFCEASDTVPSYSCLRN